MNRSLNQDLFYVGGQTYSYSLELTSKIGSIRYSSLLKDGPSKVIYITFCCSFFAWRSSDKLLFSVMRLACWATGNVFVNFCGYRSSDSDNFSTVYLKT